jgi:hypothetical protein
MIKYKSFSCVTIVFIVIISELVNLNYCKAQGCSDAGFCTMGAMRPNQNFSKKVNFTLRSVEMNQYFGMTSFYLKILAYNVDLNIGITPKLTAQVKLPYQFVFGRLANTQGLGDISISATYNLFSNEKIQLNASVGTKIPTGNSNIKTSVELKTGGTADLPLPMYYQPTLGSYDIIAGISLSTKNWLFATGYQQALTQNGNEFLWGPWNKSVDSAAAGLYPKSKNLLRGTDIMLRIERNFRFSNWNMYVGLLNIYRITKDEFTEPTGLRSTVRTENYMWDDDIHTHNFATSLLVGAGYRFNTKSAVKIMFGYRLVDRNSFQVKGKNQNFEMHRNPDGLSRLLVTNISYEYRF